MLKRPLFLVAIAFGAGIVLVASSGLPLSIGLIGLGLGCIFAVARKAFTVALLLLVAATGMLRYASFTIIPPDDVSNFVSARPSGVVGRVGSDIDLREDKAFFQLEVRSVEVRGRMVPATGSLWVTYMRPANPPDWQPPVYGDVLRIRSRISRPAPVSNPGDFSWADYLARQGIYATTRIWQPGQAEQLRKDPESLFVVLGIRARNWVAAGISEAMPADEASVVVGMDLGTYTVLPQRILSNFKKTGTLHLLAASGFNCAALIIVFGFILSRIGRLPKKWLHPILVVVLIFYMTMVGAKPSIVRATIMASLVLIGWILDRPEDPVNLLFAAAIIILSFNPTTLFDVGFQLSFAAVLGLILVLPVIKVGLESWAPRLRWGNSVSKGCHYVLREAWLAFSATAAATLGTLPLSAYYFNQFSVVSVVVNVIVAATVLPIFAVGVLLPVFGHVPGVGYLLAQAGTMLTRLALTSINYFGELPGSCVSVQSPGIVGIIGYYVVLAAVLRYVYSRIPERKRAGGA